MRVSDDVAEATVAGVGCFAAGLGCAVMIGLIIGVPVIIVKILWSLV